MSASPPIPLLCGLAEVVLQGVTLHREPPFRPGDVEECSEVTVLDLELLHRRLDARGFDVPKGLRLERASYGDVPAGPFVEETAHHRRAVATTARHLQEALANDRKEVRVFATCVIEGLLRAEWVLDCGKIEQGAHQRGARNSVDHRQIDPPKVLRLVNGVAVVFARPSPPLNDHLDHGAVVPVEGVQRRSGPMRPHPPESSTARITRRCHVSGTPLDPVDR